LNGRLKPDIDNLIRANASEVPVLSTNPTVRSYFTKPAFVALGKPGILISTGDLTQQISTLVLPNDVPQDIVIRAYDDNMFGVEKTIKNVKFYSNKTTVLKGRLFGDSGGFNGSGITVKVEDAWDEDDVIIF
jgi:hypothetical protein